MVYDALEELGDQVIFVGGATVSLYGDKVSAEIRPTYDVDQNKYVTIAEDGLQITFTPSRPAEKPDKGFLHKDKDESVSINYRATNQEIIVALELAFSKCG